MSFRTPYGNAYSENGWRMCDRNECDVVRTAPYMDTAPMRRGAPAVILGAWAKWAHENVRAITTPVWGWSAVNDVRNSNHLAGTGIDLWAPFLPWGLRRMPREQITMVRHGLTLFPEVFWGADWGKADEMHFQLRYREGDARNDAAMRRILGQGVNIPTAPKPLPNTGGRPVLRRGSGGSDVTYLQAFLNRVYRSYSNLTVDGDFGPATEAVVREFQKRARIGVDGVVGPATWKALGL